MSAKIYAIRALPQHWVVEIAQQLWLVPAMANGWHLRTQYNGQDPKSAGADQVPMHITMGCDIPAK